MKKMVNGKEAEVQEIEPVLVQELWNEYQMPNGDVLRVKYVATAVYKVINGDVNNSEYSVDFNPVVRVIKARA